MQHPWKQLLLLPRDTLDALAFQAGQLKEDIVVMPDFDLHDLPSGSVIQIGSVKLRLTFHCEHCSKIKHLGNIKKLVHRHVFADRIKWYLNQYTTPILVVGLVKAIGLSSSYCRAVPNIIRHRTDIDKELIIYKNKLAKI